LIKPIFKKQDSVELENQELASLRDWLLPMLMNGQVSVSDFEELRMVAEEREKYGN
jgi:type I restriction enzyme S subunit